MRPLLISERRFFFLSFAAFLSLVLPFHFLLAEAMNPDGVSYLDLAKAFFSGKPGALFNSYWAPLLPVLLAGFLWLRSYVPFGSFAYVQVPLLIVSVVLFLLAYSLLRLIWAERGWRRGHGLDRGQIAFGIFTLGLVGWAHAALTGPHTLTPDSLAGCFALAAAVCVLKAKTAGYPLRSAAVLGLCLAGGYLAKYPFFVFGLLLILLLAFENVRFAAVAALVFAGVTALWITPLSFHYGRLLFADTGRLNLAWFTGQAPPFAGYGQGAELWRWPVHAGATYSLWLDPARFHEGLEVYLPWARLLENAIRQLSWISRSMTLQVIAALGVAMFVARRPKLDWRFLWPTLAIVAYLPVTLMCRYAAVWLILAFAFWGAGLSRRLQATMGCGLWLLACCAWARLPAEGRAARASLAEAVELASYAGSTVHVEGDAFAASVVLARIDATIASQTPPPSSTIKRPWRISVSSGSASWVTPWPAISSALDTRWHFGPTASKRRNAWHRKREAVPFQVPLL